LADSLAKTDAQNFQTQICGRARKCFRFTITKPRDVHGLQCGKIAVGFCAEAINESLNDASVTRVGGFFRFDCFGPGVEKTD
jgi:hypothetical protein